MRRGPCGNDRGETLIELLATIAVMGTAVVTIIGATGTAIRLSDLHRKQATAGAYVRAFAEAIEARVAGTPTGYVSCLTDRTTYENFYASPPAPYSRSVIAVKVWNDTSFVPVGVSCMDHGVQQVSLQVRVAGANVTETLDIVIRRPCRPTDTSDTSCF
jgi:hypothetical protein